MSGRILSTGHRPPDSQRSPEQPSAPKVFRRGRPAGGSVSDTESPEVDPDWRPQDRRRNAFHHRDAGRGEVARAAPWWVQWWSGSFQARDRPSADPLGPTSWSHRDAFRNKSRSTTLATRVSRLFG